MLRENDVAIRRLAAIYWPDNVESPAFGVDERDLRLSIHAGEA